MFFAPAGNILALARLILSLVFGIGMIMALIFNREDAAHAAATDHGFVG